MLLGNDYYPISTVVSSPLQRALLTANIIASFQGLRVEVINDLTERDFGILEGHQYSELPSLAKRWEKISGKTWIFEAGGLELFPDFFDRARVVLEILKAKQEKVGGNLVAVSHAGLIRLVYAASRDLKLEETFSIEIPNCGIFVLDFE